MVVAVIRGGCGVNGGVNGGGGVVVKDPPLMLETW